MKTPKSFFFLLNFFCFTAISLFPGSSSGEELQRGGGVIGDAGSVVQLPTGATVPADFFYERQARPGTYQPVKPTDFPGLQEQYSVVLKYLCRFWCPNPQVLGKELKLYLTNQLSGQDKFPVDKKHTAINATFTYSVAPSPDHQSAWHGPVIEIQPQLFSELSPRGQALQLLHEVMHHNTRYGHEVISPLIRGLGVAFDLMDRQAQGDRSALSSAESDALKQMWTAIKILAPDFRDETFSKYVFAPNGGGVIICPRPSLNGRACDDFVATNFVSANSWVELNYFFDSVRAKPDETPVFGPVRGNEFFDVVNLLLEISPDNRTCLNNRFHHVNGGKKDVYFDKQRKIRCQGSNNLLSNVSISFGDLTLAGDDNQLSQVEINRYGSDPANTPILGHRNKVSRSVLRGGSLGNDTVIENSDLAGVLSFRGKSPDKLTIKDSWISSTKIELAVAPQLQELTINNLKIHTSTQTILIEPESSALTFSPRQRGEYFSIKPGKLGHWPFNIPGTVTIRSVEEFEKDYAGSLWMQKGE